MFWLAVKGLAEGTGEAWATDAEGGCFFGGEGDVAAGWRIAAAGSDGAGAVETGDDQVGTATFVWAGKGAGNVLCLLEAKSPKCAEVLIGQGLPNGRDG